MGARCEKHALDRVKAPNADSSVAPLAQHKLTAISNWLNRLGLFVSTVVCCTGGTKDRLRCLPPPTPLKSPIRFGKGVRDAWSDLPLFHVTDARVCLRAAGGITLKQQ